MLIACDWTKKYCSSASRPVKPAPVGLSRFGSMARPRSLTSSSTKRRLRIGSVLAVPSERSCLTVEARLGDGADAGLRRAAQPAHRGAGGVGERAEALEELRRGRGRRGAGRAAPGSAAARSCRARRASGAARAGSPAACRPSSAARSRGWPRPASCRPPRARSARRRGGCGRSRRRTRVGVARELAERLPVALRMLSTFSVSRSAGTARRSVVCTSSPRAVRPIPSSVRMSPKRSRAGRRRMSSTRSGGIVPAVCSTGILSGAGPACLPGSQSR